MHRSTKVEIHLHLSYTTYEEVNFFQFSLVSLSVWGSGPDLRTGCLGHGQIWGCLCCPVGSSAVICVGGAPVSEAVPSKAAPAPAVEPTLHRSCLTPTCTHTQMWNSGCLGNVLIPFHSPISVQMDLL